MAHVLTRAAGSQPGYLCPAARWLVAVAWLSAPPSTSGQEQPHVDPDRPEERQRPFIAPATIVLEAAAGPRSGWDGAALAGEISARVRIRGMSAGVLAGGEWTGRMYDADPDNVYLGALLGLRQRTPGGREVELLGEAGRREVRVVRFFEPGYKWITLPYVGVRAGVTWETGGPVRVTGGAWVAGRVDLASSGVEWATRANCIFGDTNTSFRRIGGMALLVQLRIGTEILLGGGSHD